MAVKVIQKSNILTIDGVLKVERELKALHALGAAASHPNIIQYKECLHGRRALYIITEEIPLDLVSTYTYILAETTVNIAPNVL